MSIVESAYGAVLSQENLSSFILPDAPAVRSALAADRRSAVFGKLTRSLVAQRLTAVAHTAREIPFDGDSRFVFFSDCHRGDLGRTDAFAANEKLFLYALDHYYRHGFTYVEVGDGDDLWQNRRFRDIVQSHWAVFDRLHRFNREKRLHIITGNHDMPFRLRHGITKDGIRSEDALALRHRRTGQRILVTHGHQADIMSDRLSVVSHLAVRYIWRYAQDWRLTDLFRTVLASKGGVEAASESEAAAQLLCTIEKRLMNWASESRQMVICGHTHRARAAAPGAPPYFNSGSVIVPGEATSLEIQGDEICLVRWTAHPVTGKVRRERLTSPQRLATYT